MKKKVKNDLYHISIRVRHIDPSYFVVYDTRRKTYEIHHSKQRGGSLALHIPYHMLDSRTIKLLYKTRSRNAEKIFKSIEKNNSMRDRFHDNELHDLIDYRAREVVEYESNTTKTASRYYDCVWY